MGWLAALPLLIAGLACSVDPPRNVYTFQGPTMGTTFSVKVVAGDLSLEQQNTITKLIQSELDSVNAKMSTYLPSSELSLFNALQETTPTPVSPQMLEVLVEARQIGAATGGAFDITVGPLVNAWGFGPDQRSAHGPSRGDRPA